MKYSYRAEYQELWSVQAEQHLQEKGYSFKSKSPLFENGLIIDNPEQQDSATIIL